MHGYPIAHKIISDGLFFTSDTHFGHANIIEYRNRPFGSVQEMDEELIRRWNVVVGPTDTIYHLGDFVFANYARAAAIMSRLNGRKILVVGNHDHMKTPSATIAFTNLFHSFHDYLELDVEGTKVVLSHYPFEVWNGSHRGSIHLHGHMHGTLRKKEGRVDVGVDCWVYAPVSFQEIMGLAKSSVDTAIVPWYT